MLDEFNVRFATITDSAIIGWHRARMFRDMGYVPAELFDLFRVKSEARLRVAFASGEYVGWLASQRNSPQTIIAGAGVQLRRVLPHPVAEAGGEITICDGRQGIILNVFTEPEWRRRGIAALLMKTIIEWSREQRLDGLVLHASDEARALYERLGFISTNEMRFGGNLAAAPFPL
jgi:GNAT superfamily N-acetyltransferase